MKNIKLGIVGLILLVAGSSCSDYLEPYPNGDISGDDLWKYQDKVQGLVNQCYLYMPQNYSDNEGAILDCATDNAVYTSTTNNMSRLAVGTLTTGQDMFATYWDRDYKAINLLNMFLKDNRGYKTRYMVNAHYNDLVKNRLQGEAFALRAWFQWDLLQKFGGMGLNGQLLGFPIVTEPLDATQPINLARSSYDDCVKQIISDCDSAYKYLPLAHRDVLVPVVADRIYAGSKYWGRMDGITTRAIKSQVYLTWASPRFNPGNDVARWDSAAVNAKKVIDFKLTVDKNITSGFVMVNKVDWFNPEFPGIVFSSRYVDNSDAIERMFYPGGFQGNGQVGATQEFVDAFPMSNGYPITDARSGYNPNNPYVGRDPRFYSMVFYNGAKAIKEGTSTAMYTFENIEGGKDAKLAKSTNSRTNYHVKKFVYMGLNWSESTVKKAKHAKFFYRWAHMCLMFAEAANHVVGPTDASRYGMSAKTAMQYLRLRKTYDNASGFTVDPYLDEVSLDQTAFDAFVKNERRIETSFEGMRFFDLRRWSTSLDQLNMAVHGIEIVKNADGTFNYTPVEVEKRTFKSAYLPIPYSEVMKMSNLVQNEGWDSWK